MGFYVHGQMQRAQEGVPRVVGWRMRSGRLLSIRKPALSATDPINPPRTAMNGAMGVVIGLVLGLVVAFIMETFDTSLGAIEEVEQTLGTQVLGVVPQADPGQVQEILTEKFPEGIKGHPQRHAVNLISHFVPKSMMAESFRALRMNIDSKDVGEKLKTIVITSSSPQEGKTLVAANLALIIARPGRERF